MAFVSTDDPPASLRERAECPPVGDYWQSRRLLAQRLTNDPRMARVWRQLRRRLAERAMHVNQLDILSFAIIDAHARCRIPPRKRSELARQYRKTAKRARELAALVKDGRLDDTVYHLYSEEAARSTLALIRGTDSRKEPTPQQIAEHAAEWLAERRGIPVAAAYLDAVAPKFPALAAILEAAAREADRAATEVMTESRVVERPGAGNYTVNYFVRCIAEHLNDHFGGEMRGTLATLASVSLEMDVTEEVVSNALRPER